MSIGDLFWVFFIFLFIYPYFFNWWLGRKKELYIRAIGRKGNSQVITLVHAPSRFSLLGLPFFKMIDMSDMEDIIDAIRATPKNKPIDLILHVTGGMVLAAGQIARVLSAHPARTRVIVPYYAMSGGTLIALGADEIVMSENSFLGPVDVQILSFKGALPARTLDKVVKKKRGKVDDDTMVMSEIGMQASRQSREMIVDLLIKKKIDRRKAVKIADFLTIGDKTHDYPISAKEAKDLGLNVRIGITPEIYRLMDAYRIYRQPNVDVLYRK